MPERRSAAEFVPTGGGLAALRRAAAGCQGCDQRAELQGVLAAL